VKKACLLILDGAGYSTTEHGNAVTSETLPRMFGHMQEHGFCVLEAASEAVGLEAGQVGNSEAGHLTIGAGAVVPCMTKRICIAFDDGSWRDDEGWQIAREAGVLHLVGLVSDAGVHGLARTIVQSAQTARAAGVDEVHVHPVLDGVDSLKGTAPRLLEELRSQLEALNGVHLGVVFGRKWFCDRSGDLDVTRVAVDALGGKTELATFTPESLTAHLSNEVAGEMSFPARLFAGGRPIAAGEPVLITSHRADRARQAARVLGDEHPVLMLVDPGQDVPVQHVFFPQEPLTRGLAHELARAGLRSARIAEKCKFPHVTFFLNGFDAGAEGEGHCIPSIPEGEIPAKPEMSLAEVTDEIVKHLESSDARAVIANLANLDQVGHLGRLDLATTAARVVDEAFERIARAAWENGWTLMVTADHGNAERVEDEGGTPFGSHTDGPVPFLIQPAPGRRTQWRAEHGSLAQVASTYLLALGLEAPEWMEPPLAVLEVEG